MTVQHVADNRASARWSKSTLSKHHFSDLGTWGGTDEPVLASDPCDPAA
jgi:hypothetical protein